jgi:hypothetical protein
LKFNTTVCHSEKAGIPKLELLASSVVELSEMIKSFDQGSVATWDLVKERISKKHDEFTVMGADHDSISLVNNVPQLTLMGFHALS